MSRDVVNKILETSRAIDRMRVETDQVVRTVIGLIEPVMWVSDPNTWRKKQEVSSGSYWEFAALNRKLHARYVRHVVRDDRTVLNDGKVLVVDYSSSPSWINGVRWGNSIEYPWRALPEFVDFAKATFPHALEQNLRVFFERGMTA